MNTQSVGFKILDASINDANQVFDQLVKVEHLITKEVGYLLCSHYSKWPESKIDQATWLAGCLTPLKYFNEPKLVFGVPNPNYVINWHIDTENRTIELVCGGVPCSEDEYGDELNYQIVWKQTTLPVPPRIKQRIKAIYRLLFGRQEVDNSRFYAIHNHFDRHREGFSTEMFYINQVIPYTPSYDEHWQVWRGYDFGCETEFSFVYEQNNFTYAATIPMGSEVVEITLWSDNPEEDLVENLPYTKECNTLTVIRALPDYGYLPARLI